jgi:hypothetical protein
MKGYRSYTTIMGRKYYVRMTSDELREQKLFRLSMFLVPTVFMLLLFMAAGFFW